MKEFFHASRLDTSSVLSETRLTWLTTTGSAPAAASGTEVSESSKSRRQTRRGFIFLRRSELMLRSDQYSYPYRPNRRMMKQVGARPDAIRDTAHLDDLLSTPTEPAIDAVRGLDG